MSNKTLIASVILVLSASACSREMLEAPTIKGDGAIPIDISGEIDQIATRATAAGFVDGDAVGLYVVNYKEGNVGPGTLQLSGNQADNVKYVFDEADNSWKPSSPVYYYDKTTHVDFYGYYPYASPSSITEYAFEVEKDQSKEAANGKMASYEASDFLWAKTENVAPVAAPVSVRFDHKMAGVTVSLVEGTGFSTGEFASVQKAVLVTNTVRKAKINLSDGTVTADGEVPSTGIIPIVSGEDYRAIVVPQTVQAGTPLFTLTVDGLPYTYRKEEPMEYVSGRLHKFSISISKKSDSGLEFTFLGEAITPWEEDNVSHDGTAREYVVVHCPEAGKLKETIVASGKDYTKIKNLKVTGSITDEDYYFMRDEMPVLTNLNLKNLESSYCTVSIYKIQNDGNVTFLRTAKCEAVPNRAFSNKRSLIRFIFPDCIVSVGESAFEGSNLSGSLILPNKVKDIGSAAFKGCPFTGTLSLSDQLEYIWDYAFSSCSLTGGLYIPNSVKVIGDGAFSGCYKLTGELFFPANLSFLGKNAFLSCYGFTGTLVFPSQLDEVPDACFEHCDGFDEIILHEGIHTIGYAAFYGCSLKSTLLLPESITVIDDNAFAHCFFSGELKLTKNLSYLGKSAFSYNAGLIGRLEIPEELNAISAESFAGCSNLQEVIIPKNVDVISRYAFYECSQLVSIKCLADTPPRLESMVFDGVGKDNFTVEVPENSINDYITAPGWNEFKRFSAYRDFSINNRLFRSLNAENYRQVLVRAPLDASWSIDSKPDWVNVSPSSGQGYTEVTITVSELSRGTGNREGEVVFLLDGKDYRVRTKVEQYDYQYGDGDVITYQSHSVGEGVNLVFMGDCFDAKDISEGKYAAAMEEAIGYFFAIEPYKTYRDYFNVYSVVGLSPDSGIGNVNTIRETRFGTQYTLNEGLTPDAATCFEAACLAPINDDVAHTLVVMIENSELYSGVTYMYGDGSAIALCPMSRDVYPYDFRGLVQHEAGGHGFGKLADEYIYHNAFVTSCPISCDDYLARSGYYQKKNLGWYANIHHSGKLHDVPWYHLMFDPKYMGTVDIYEGAYLHTRGVFRSEPNSCMNNNIPYFSAISREAIVKRIMEYAGEEYTFEKFKENDVKIAVSPSMLTKGEGTVLSNTFRPGHQQEPRYMGDKPIFNKPRR